MSEEWRAVAGFDQYEVSNEGRLRRSGRVLVGGINSAGYRMVILWLDGKRNDRQLHSLVAEAFLGERPALAVVNHKDGNKDHNAVSNLEWASQSENQRHAYRTGLRKSKLDSEAVADILQSTESMAVLARRYSVNKTAIFYVKHRVTHA